MKAVTKILAGAAVIAAAAGGFAAPAAAQYYPGTGYGQGIGGLGGILDVILNAQRYGYGYQGYANDRSQIDRCAVAVEQRINRDYGYRYGSPYGSPYGGYGNYNSPYGGNYNNQYGYNQYGAGGGAKVVGITRVERRSGSTTRVRGIATANVYANQYGQYGGQYGGQYNQPYGGQYGYNNYGYTNAGELSFKCDIDYRGYIKDIDIDRNTNAYYGYRRY